MNVCSMLQLAPVAALACLAAAARADELPVYPQPAGPHSTMPRTRPPPSIRESHPSGPTR